MPTVASSEILQSEGPDWAAVRFLTRELHRTEKLAAQIAQWDSTVRLFRQIEQTQFYEKDPTENDRANHRALLHLLIGLGRNLLLQTHSLTDQQLAGYGITRRDLEAYIADLEDTLFMFYVPDFEPVKTAELQKAIFGG